jgi:hypothetical protein
MKTLRHSLAIAATVCGLSGVSHAQTPEPAAETTAAAPVAEQAPAVPSVASPVAAPAPEEALDLAALGMGDSSSGPATQESTDLPLNIYGFGDFGIQAPLYKEDNIWASQYQPSYSKMAVGNLNMYLSKQLDKKWSVLTEVRFHYAPNSKVGDPSDSERSVNMGGIEIERAHVDYQHHQLLNVRAGQWLTPYGIWNVDHGTPTLIAIARPYSVGDQLFPERQTGLLIFGGDYAGPVRLGYNLGISNGRGPKDAFADLDKNKAITARTDLTWSGDVGDVKLGLSFYAGRYTDANQPKGDFANGKSVNDIKTQYDERSFGADLQYDVAGLVVRAELIVNDRNFVDPYRPKNGGSTFTSDTRRLGYYGLVGYRIPSLSLMPYFLFEDYKFGDGQGFVKKAKIYYTGLNWQIVPRVVAKLEYTVVTFEGLALLEQNPMKFLSSQLAWAF